MKRWLAFLGFCLALLAAPRGAHAVDADSSTAREQLRGVYLTLVDAEWYMASRQWTNALTAYSQALAQCETLQRSYPGWQGDTLARRAADCKNQIRMLERTLAKSGATNAPPAETSATAPYEPERVRDLREELTTIRALLLNTPGPGSALSEPQHPDLRDQQLAALQHDYAELLIADRQLQRDYAAREAKWVRFEKQNGATNALTFILCKNVIRTEARRLLETGDAPGGIDLLREATALFPEDDQMLLLLASACCHALRFEDALSLLKDFPETKSNGEELHLVRGTAYMGTGLLGPARVEMEKALKIRPQSATAHYNMAQILVSLSPPDLKAAETHYRAALENGGSRDAKLEHMFQAAALMQKSLTAP